MTFSKIIEYYRTEHEFKKGFKQPLFKKQSGAFDRISKHSAFWKSEGKFV